MKNVLLVQAFVVLFLSDTYEGSVHDKAIVDITPYELPPHSEVIDDLGFVGFVLPGVCHSRPFRKPKGSQLTSEQNEHNRHVSQQRVRIEHVIASVKRCRIVKDTIRLWKDGVRDLVMELACGLHNFRLQLNPWP